MEFLENIPAIPPPPGVQSHFGHRTSLSFSLLYINAVFLPLMVVAVGIRVYTRIFIVNALGWDDYTCIGAALSSIAHTVLCLLSLHIGYGSHLWDIRAITLTPPHVRTISSLSFIYVLAILLTKLSICLLYLRIFGVNPTFRKFVHGGMIFCGIYYSAFFGVSVAQVFTCDKPSTLHNSLCVKTQELLLVQALLNAATDVYVFLLPMKPIMQLNMRWERKTGILIVFLVGAIALAVSIARIVLVGVLLHTTDTLYTPALTSSLSVVELNVAIITASTFVLPQFFSKTKLFHLSTYSAIKYRFLSGRNRSRSSSRKNQNPSKDSNDVWPLVETRVLGSIQGDGRFIRTNAFESALRPTSLRNEEDEQFATPRDLWERKV